MSALAPAMQAYFSDRLIAQRGASPNTIAAYCQTFRLLLGFASKRRGKPPSELDIAELDAPLIAAFLDHLEKARGNSVRSRNNRLAAIHSLFTYMALHHPEHAASIQRVLAIPHKRTERNLVTYLTEPEVRKVLKAWLKERSGAPDDPLFPTTTGGHLSRDAIERRLARHLAVAAERCPSIKAKHVTMHTLRHTAAMRLLLAGNDVTVIALWLGHEQISTTNVYLHADMTHKQQAIDRTKPLAAKPGHYRPPRHATEIPRGPVNMPTVSGPEPS